MKKTFVFILLFALCGTLFASDLFLSPSRLAGALIDNPFTVRVEGELGVDAVKFLADPLALDTYSESSVRVLLEKDLAFWKANPDVVSAFSETMRSTRSLSSATSTSPGSPPAREAI